MHNTTAASFRQNQNVSVVDAIATSLLSYFLLSVVQWIVTSGILAIFGKVILIFAASGIVANLLTPSQPKQKGLNGDHRNTSKKHV